MNKQSDIETIECPKCGQKIQLTDVLRKRIEDKVHTDYHEQMEKRETEHQAALKRKDQELVAKLKEERERTEAKARKEASEKNATETKDLQTQVKELSQRLEESQKNELTLRKRERELEASKKSLELEVARRVDQGKTKIYEQAKNKSDEEYKLKVREKDIHIERMAKQIEELNRKAEQGSNQVQGEAQEVELYELLVGTFKYDNITRVRKGKEGADDLMEVHNHLGAMCGSILFESKRTKSWSDNWIEKAKEDQREARADLVVIVSRALPKDFAHIGRKEGVWICDLQSATGLGVALREVLIRVSQARIALAGKNEKMDLIYQYLSGPEFRNRVEAIIEAFRYMKEDLEAEKRGTYKRWAEREKQIEKVISNTAGLYGDLQGIIGGSLPEVKALELPAAEAKEEVHSDDLPF